MLRKNILYGAIVFLLGMFVLLPMNVQAATVQEEIIYDVLIDRYNNGDQSISEEIDLDNPIGYHGGDLQGITDRLDEIQENGFTTINLSSPFANAPNGFHGYWIEDFYEIESQFGTKETLEQLIKEAHKRDLKVMLELPTNYMAKTHPFVDDGEHDDWFTDVQAPAEDSTEWLNEVVQLDQTNTDVQKYIEEVSFFWMDELDIDGYTFYGVDQMDPSFLEDLTTTLKKKDNQMMLIGKIIDKQANIDPFLSMENLDAVQNQEVLEKLVEVMQEPDVGLDELDELLLSDDHYKSILMVDNKNEARFSNLVRDHGRNSVTAWKLTLAYLYMMPGTPMIYQGSEIPMYGPGYPENQMLIDSTGAEPDMDDTFSKYSSLRDQFKKYIAGDVEVIGREGGMTLYDLSVDDDHIYVAINNDSHSNSVKMEDLSEDVQLRGLLNDDTIRKNKDGVHSIGLERETAEVFMIQPNTGFNWTFIGLVVVIFVLFIGGVLFLTLKQKKREN